MPALDPAAVAAYADHLAADEAWMDEIRRAFPREWAGDVRYTPRAHGEPGTLLAAAYERYLATRAEWERYLPHYERSVA
ncbi:hypothetical protein [Rhizobium sp. SSA_523]|uniref:hypothetical protein n=1 Tax=Rhizobium sp. SSA_523 TaxID=2952477 RepID=UPI0020901D1E|nr:hypothetical protein [Rhizobium sp. SSA_523]MCO5730101.1 hypothetical protein [Rhizobium sp. SSA_523]WKC25166.1 hypothetical protein QTJ18_14355 [Rhizobium sp. SSA_523]